MNLRIVILPKKILADGRHKIRIAISHRGATRYFLTRFIVDSEKHLKNGNVVGVREASYINAQLRAQMQEIYEIYDKIELPHFYTCSQLVEIISDKIHEAKMKTLRDVFEQYISLCSCGQSSINVYRTNMVAAFDFFGEDYILQRFNEKSLKSYIDHLLKIGKSKQTINAYVATLRALVLFAEKRKIVEYEISPFESYKIFPKTSRKASVSLENLATLRDAELHGHTAKVRDVILLSFYLAGMNVVDMLQQDFRKDHVSFQRQKTRNRRSDGEMVEFSIHPKAREIIDRYIRKDGTLAIEDCNRSKISSYIGRYLRDIVGNDNFIFYSARKTFAQTAYELGFSEHLIEYCIGDVQSKSRIVNYYIRSTRQMADRLITAVIEEFEKTKSPPPSRATETE